MGHRRSALASPPPPVGVRWALHRNDGSRVYRPRPSEAREDLSSTGQRCTEPEARLECAPHPSAAACLEVRRYSELNPPPIRIANGQDSHRSESNTAEQEVDSLRHQATMHATPSLPLPQTAGLRMVHQRSSRAAGSRGIRSNGLRAHGLPTNGSTPAVTARHSPDVRSASPQLRWHTPTRGDTRRTVWAGLVIMRSRVRPPHPAPSNALVSAMMGRSESLRWRQEARTRRTCSWPRVPRIHGGSQGGLGGTSSVRVVQSSQSVTLVCAPRGDAFLGSRWVS